MEGDISLIYYQIVELEKHFDYLLGLGSEGYIVSYTENLRDFNIIKISNKYV